LDIKANRPLTLSQKSKTDKRKPKLLFFGPTSDPGTVKRLRPVISLYYNIEHFEDVYEALEEVKKSKQPYAVCITKLGTNTNLGKYLIKIIRELHGNETYIILHSATAAQQQESKDYWLKNGVNMIVEHDTEMSIEPVLKEIAKKYAEKK